MSGRALPWLRPAGTGGFVPGSTGGPLWRALDWLRRNLFGTRMNTLLTLLVLAFLALIVPPLLRWAVVHASFGGGRAPPAGRTARAGPSSACVCRCSFSAAIRPRNAGASSAALLLLAGFAAPVLREHVRHRWLWVLLLLTLMPAARRHSARRRRVRPHAGRYQCVGRADARRADLLRHRRRLAAARRAAGARPPLAACPWCACSRSASSSCGAACRC